MDGIGQIGHKELPLSQEIRVGNRIYMSGQGPLNVETARILNTVEDQTRQVLINIKNILEAIEAEMSDVVKLAHTIKRVWASL
ncbi:RidA family protein [Sporolactobacillus nakayamae]